MSPPDGNVFALDPLPRACGQCALRSLCLGAGADARTLAQLERLLQYRPPLAAGDTLYHAGEPMRFVCIVRSGALKSVAEHEDGSEQLIGFHLPGELIGMDGFGSGRHGCRVEALERSRVCAIPWEPLQSLAVETPSLRRQLMAAIGHETLAAHRHLGMMGQPAPRRLGLFLREIAQRRSRLSLDPDALQLPMSREDIANFLGMAEETVCRQFSRLQDEGVLHVQRKTVRILDPARLDAPVPPRTARHAATPRRSTTHAVRCA